MSEVLEVLNPVSTTHGIVEQSNLAPRIKSLDFKKVGLLWNSKPGGDVALNRVGELLQSRFKDVEIVRFDGGIGTNSKLVEVAKTECEVAVGSAAD